MTRRIFCDLDGVLVDFDRGVMAVCRRPPHDLPPAKMWSQLARSGDFYANLPWTKDGRELWEYILPFHPTILSGLPMGKWAAPQKRIWCSRELGPQVAVILCMSRDKHKQAAAGDILIDDRISLKEPWEQAGGIFVYHTDTKSTIQRLKELGVAPASASVS